MAAITDTADGGNAVVNRRGSKTSKQIAEESQAAASAVADPVVEVKRDYEALSKEFSEFSKKHNAYLKTMATVHATQESHLKEFHHEIYRLKQIRSTIRELLNPKKSASSSTAAGRPSSPLTPEQSQSLRGLLVRISERETYLSEVSNAYPKSPNFYLRIIMGNLNVSLMSRSEKYRYKEEYERFKLICTTVSTIISFFCLFFIKYRAIDALFHFMLVWYYCTVTIRETVLRVNGSRVKNWWIMHHYISAVVFGLIVTWPDSITYHKFRSQFLYFCLYLGALQMLQFQYQREQLRKMRALGESKGLEITVDGFAHWMWKGLSFILPVLILGYVFQLYNAYTLFQISRLRVCNEWQVIWLAILFFVLACGNIITTGEVVFAKFFHYVETQRTKLIAQAKYHRQETHTVARRPSSVMSNTSDFASASNSPSKTSSPGEQRRRSTKEEARNKIHTGDSFEAGQSNASKRAVVVTDLPMPSEQQPRQPAENVDADAPRALDTDNSSTVSSEKDGIRLRTSAVATDSTSSSSDNRIADAGLTHETG